MKNLLLSIFAILSLNSYAQVAGLTISNAHQVDREGRVFRGKEPRKLVSELSSIGITDVIIFKNDVKGEVIKEISDLKNLKIRSHHIPFRWKEYSTMTEACEQIVQALNIIDEVRRSSGKVFFHCTAGEDRTGALAALFLMLDENQSARQAFRGEMCGRGYSDGSSHKPSVVTSAIEKELTPLFVALAKRIENGAWRMGKLTKASCQNLNITPTALKCRK